MLVIGDNNYIVSHVVAKTIDAGYSVRVCLTERAGTNANNTTSINYNNNINNSKNNKNNNINSKLNNGNMNSNSNINNSSKNDQSTHIKNISNSNSNITQQQR